MRFLTHITAVLLGYVTVDCRVSPNIQNTAVGYKQSDLSTADAGNTTSETASKKSTAKKRRVKRRRSKVIKANPAKPSTPSATNFVSKSMSTMKNAASATMIAARQNPATVAALTTVLVALLAETTGITNIREYLASLIRTGAVEEVKIPGNQHCSSAFSDNVSASTTDIAGSVPGNQQSSSDLPKTVVAGTTDDRAECRITNIGEYIASLLGPGEKELSKTDIASIIEEVKQSSLRSDTGLNAYFQAENYIKPSLLLPNPVPSVPVARAVVTE